MLATVLHISKCPKNKSSVVPWSTFMHTACSVLHNGSTQSAQPLGRRLHSQTLADKVEPQHAVVTLRPVQYVVSRSHTRRWRRRTRLVDERRPQTCEYDVSVPLGVSLCQRRRVHTSGHGVGVLKRHRPTECTSAELCDHNECTNTTTMSLLGMHKATVLPNCLHCDRTAALFLIYILQLRNEQGCNTRI